MEVHVLIERMMLHLPSHANACNRNTMHRMLVSECFILPDSGRSSSIVQSRSKYGMLMPCEHPWVDTNHSAEFWKVAIATYNIFSQCGHAWVW